MDETFYGLSIQNVCRIVFEFAEENCIIHLFNKQNENMAGLDFVKGFSNPANKSKKVILKSSKKLNTPKEKVIATDQKDWECLLCTGMYSKPGEEWVACMHGSMMTVVHHFQLQELYVIFACNSSINFRQHLNYILSKIYLCFILICLVSCFAPTMRGKTRHQHPSQFCL